MLDPLDLAEGVPIGAHSLDHGGLVSLGQLENLPLERAAAQGCLETSLLLILPDEFGEVGPDLLSDYYEFVRCSNDNFRLAFTSWFPSWLMLAGMNCTS